MKSTTKSNTTRLNSALLAVMLAAAPALGQEPAKTPVFVDPVPLMQEGRFQPGVRVEGLITARYTVKTDGSTDDIEILGGFTNPFYENAIRETVKKWTFTPGSVDGTPRDFLNQEYTFKFRVSDTLAISKEVDEQLQVIRETIDKKEFADAGKQINSILRRGVQSVLDYGLMNEMMVQVNLGLEDPYAALEASQRATASSPGINGEPEYLLTPGLLQGALRQQVMVAATIRQQGTVLETWKKLDALFDLPADDSVHQWIKAAEDAVASPDQLVSLAKINDDGHWVQAPLRRIFSVSDVREGKLKRIVAHCQRRTLELEFQEGVDWNLPASLGHCELDFQGDEGTLFALYEFAQ